MQYFDSESPLIKERLVAKDEWVFAFPSFMPIVPGHLLLCPVRVIATAEELSEHEWLALRTLQNALCNALKKAFGAEGFNFAWNCGEIAGQSVPHFHLHIVPRKSGDTGIWQYELRLFLYRPGTRAISPSQELKEVAALVRGCL